MTFDGNATALPQAILHCRKRRRDTFFDGYISIVP